jgi:tungstate transport system ATP-binding protein
MPGDTALARIGADVLMRFEGVSVRAGLAEILNDVTVSLYRGAPTVLMGPNGSGKTTFLKLAMGLIVPTVGAIHVPTSMRQSLVFQRPVMLRRSVAENIDFARIAAGLPRSSVAISDLLATVGLAGLADRPARKLSGGEQQRLALARALAREPDVLFLDEPTASLDPASTKAIEDLIASIAASGVKIVMATHDLGQAKRLAGDAVLFVGGRVVEHAPRSQFFDAPMSDVTRRFIAGELVF